MASGAGRGRSAAASMAAARTAGDRVAGSTKAMSPRAASRRARRICSLHDPTAAAVLADPAVVTGFGEGPVNVIDDGGGSRAWLMEREDGGGLVQDIEPAPPTRVVTAVDRQRVSSGLVEALTAARTTEPQHEEAAR